MTEADYQKSQAELFTRWKQARPEYDNEPEGKRFSLDGIQNFDAWIKSAPKILFLLKENRAGEKEDWEPCQQINRDANPFSWNIIRWRQLLLDLYHKTPKEPIFLKSELPKSVDDIAIIEVKKVNEGKGSSSESDIRHYARQDKDFIIEQIELINPDIVFCCYTGGSYGDIYIDDAEPWKPMIEDSGCVCNTHRHRLVIDFFHPSTRSMVREQELFDVLYRMIKNGRIFEKFNWS